MGETRSLGAAHLRVLSPHPEVLSDARNAQAVDPNRLSAALVIEWEGIRVVLAADLPRREWIKVLRDNPDGRPGDHAGLKVPHHGSADAQHDDLCEPDDGRARTWWLTPWNRGTKLPRFDDGQGLASLLGKVATIYMTSLPHETSLPSDQRRATRGEIDNAHLRERFGSADMLLMYEATVDDPFEAWFSVEFEADGRTTVAQGSASWEITR